MKIKIATWNIAGGHPIASLDYFDYLPEDPEYFVNELKKIDPDIVCFQESHTKIDNSSSNAKDITDKLGFSYLFNSPSSKSHVDNTCMLSTAIIAKNKFNTEKLVFYPNPKGDLFWSDGRLADTHEKNLQIVSNGQFSVANNQMLPIRLFGFTYDDGARGTEFANSINLVMKSEIKSPVIWCGDFNFSDPQKVFSIINELNLINALPDEGTRPSKDGSKKKSDFIFYSSEFKLINSGIIETNTNHYLCWAEFEY